MEKKINMSEELGTYNKEAHGAIVYASDAKVLKNYGEVKCPDCYKELEVPIDTQVGEILSCPGCGLELEVKKADGKEVDLQELTIEGEDWGE
jgi:alpha-aminoadipate carrier protein LysW